jgi:hypothetical protein
MGKVMLGMMIPASSAADAIKRLFETGGFRGGILGLQEDDPFIDRLIDAAHEAGHSVANALVGGFDDKKPMERIANEIKSMLGQTIPADAIPFAGKLGEDLGAAMAEGAAKKLKTVLGQTIPGAVADVSKALQSDKNRSDEAKPGKMGNLGQFVTQGDGRLGDAAAVVGSMLSQAPELAGSEGKLTGMAFVEQYQVSLQTLVPESIVNVTDFFADVRRLGIRPALLAMGTQMYLGGQTAISMVGDALDEGVGGFEAKGRSAGEAYMRGFQSAMSGIGSAGTGGRSFFGGGLNAMLGSQGEL